jgi:succinate dehydrogenase/fumarate reductase flavoprotein subunit
LSPDGKEQKQPAFHIILNGAAAAVANKHVPLYSRKGLLQKYDTLTALAEERGLPLPKLEATFRSYDKIAMSGGKDEFGKQYFHNTPLSQGPFYAGLVTPALHYSMGGVAIDTEAHVVRNGGEPISNLYAAGEIVGGIHGTNRLGGNAMTECVVFGMVAAQSVADSLKTDVNVPVVPNSQPVAQEPAAAPKEAQITKEQLAHNDGRNGSPLWTAIHGQVYDLTEFADEHPAGPEPIHKVAGMDGTEVFDEIHSVDMLNDFKPVGKLAA